MGYVRRAVLMVVILALGACHAAASPAPRGAGGIEVSSPAAAPGHHLVAARRLLRLFSPPRGRADLIQTIQKTINGGVGRAGIVQPVTTGDIGAALGIAAPPRPSRAPPHATGLAAAGRGRG
ncbi:MAG: hypothetical protein J3K34DRAFT_457919 [Monoraphidium minutum]|nr:MAG: hypothetical protein J3K34DRAFT_457919 [Monoraphidium minutum]